ncbi:helix-turn-helix transcriptional regulator [Hydrocarboniphaga effusa]|uniref:helix-turn-helix domain-containing protein n=1 Tax=Hydrocarboniphaga effusa TaxID=243629 RepID=UPI003137D659
MKPVHQRLGPIVREARIAQGWSQERLAETAGLDRSYVGEIERGRVSPTLLTLEKLATALRLSPSELIGRCELRSPPDSTQNSRLPLAGDSP